VDQVVIGDAAITLHISQVSSVAGCCPLPPQSGQTRVSEHIRALSSCWVWWDDLPVDLSWRDLLTGAVSSSLYKGHRYPVEIISHCVWLYFRFPLSYREVEEMMMARGVLVTYETIQGWCRKSRQIPTRTDCAVADHARGISATSTRCSSRSTDTGSTCGVLSTKTATC